MFEWVLFRNKMREYMATSLDSWLVIKYDTSDSANKYNASDSDNEGRGVDQ